ncbi:hypothetical protein DMA11_16825 [Marinilabiliaceae bacterium JC017]|nr:hypothetical protein DMA11_16825 [Marinilabiliaceae bacterium JC017]
MNRYSVIIIISLLATVFCNCEDTIEEDSYGSISGVVVDIVNQKPLAGAVITTNPPSMAVMSDEKGQFLLDELEEGDYVVSASRYEYRNNSVNIKVRRDKSVSVVMQLEEDEGNSMSVGLGNPFPVNNAGQAEATVALAWQVTGISNKSSLVYDLLVYSTESAEPFIEITDHADTTYTVEDLNFEQTYLWQVSAKKNGNQVGKSDLWSFRTKERPRMPFLFVRSENSNYNIFATEGKDGISNRLTQETVQNLFPKKNPVTDDVVFSAIHNAQSFIYIMDKGGEAKKISSLPVVGFHNPGIGFGWSPSGKEIIFCHYDKLYKINKDGSGLVNLSTAPVDRNYVFCAWSASANKIVVQTRGTNIYDGELYLMDTNGENRELLVDNLEGRVEYPSFSPDGKRVLFTHDLTGLNAKDGRQLNAHVMWIDIATKELTDISGSMKPDGTNDLQPAFSPDGAKVIFVSTTNTGNGQRDIWVMDVDGSDRELYFENAEMPEWH